MASTNLPKRPGWVTFAGVIALVAGTYNALSGIAAIANDDTLESQVTKVLYGIDVSVWGWLWLLVGALQIFTGVLTGTRGGTPRRLRSPTSTGTDGPTSPSRPPGTTSSTPARSCT